MSTTQGTFENAADQAALAAIEAALAAGEDVFGDNDEPSEPVSAETEAETEAEVEAADADEGEEAAAEEGEGEAAEEVAADAGEPEEAAPKAEQAPEPVADPAQYQVKPRAELQAERAALRAEKTEAFKKFSTGELGDDEYLAIVDRVDTALEVLTEQAALAVANEQTARRVQEGHVARIKALGVTQGVNYDADTDAQDEFNAALRLAASSPAIAAKGEAAVYDKAHAMVLALRGIVPTAAPKPAAPAATGKPPARERPAGPVTLRGLPAAASSQTSGGPSEQLARLKGLDFQERIGAMSREQRDAYLDS